MTRPRVLVTGGSGFLATHCILKLMDDGYRVRTTVRSERGAERVRSMVTSNALEIAHADLLADEGWDIAASGCDYVIHVASPYPSTQPAKEDDLIVPARDGALRVLRAAARTDVKRVVLTSSFAAIGYGHAHRESPYDETSWTDIHARGVTTYAKSKTLAERAAWDFAEREGLELAVVNPTGILGPILGPDYGTSVASVALLLNGRVQVLPRARIGIVDVRDVADLHIKAMTDPAANHQRFLATAGLMSLPQMAQELRSRLGTAAHKVPIRSIPDWIVRLAATFDSNSRQTLPMLGAPHRATSDKARGLLGWQPRPKEDALIATARSILDFDADSR